MALRRAVGPLRRALAAGARDAPLVSGGASAAAAQRWFASGGASDADATVDAGRSSSGVRGDGLTARFYRTVNVAPAPEGGGAHVVLLDGRTLRTPARNPLALPSLPLALAVAAEWEWQEQRNLRPFTMPIMSLCSTAIDRIPETRAHTVESLVSFFGTDALCVRAESAALARAQAAEWDPLLDWAGRELGARPAASASLLGPPHSAEALAAMRAALAACDDWELAGVAALSAAARSLVMAFALQRRRVRPADAPRLLRLEEDAQTAEWGFVEGGHDIDVADLKARIAAPVLFLDLYAASKRK